MAEPENEEDITGGLHPHLHRLDSPPVPPTVGSRETLQAHLVQDTPQKKEPGEGLASSVEELITHTEPGFQRLCLRHLPASHRTGRSQRIFL